MTFGYLNPVGKVPKTPQALGLVVYLDGDGGKSQGSIDYVRDYFEAGYEIVQMEWSDNWEQTYDPFPTTNPKTYGNVQNAACRPATFLNYIYQNVFLTSVFNNNNTAGMCAQGISGGSAAIAYALAYYGAGSYIDNAELVSGPVLSDIEQGCQVPNPQQNQWPVVCGQNGGNQYGCQLGGGSTWTLSPTYLSGTNTGVGNWTNDTSCANANGSTTMTTTLSQSNWLKQSIVDQSSVTGLGATPMFAYSNTAMSGWLCRSVVSNGVNCAAIGNNDSKDCPNNSSPQGQLFYANISSSTPNFALYATDACVTAEGVSGGNVPGYLPAIFHGTVSGFDAITDDMIGNSSPLITPKCIRRH